VENEVKSLKTWKKEKAKALRKYIIARFSDAGFSVYFAEYENDFKWVTFWNGAFKIRYSKTVLQCEKSVEYDIKAIISDVKEAKTEIYKAWGEDLDAKYVLPTYFELEDLMRSFVADKNRTALLLCWYHDEKRIADVKKYEENIRNEFMDNLFGAQNL
jgi:uncharacterized protein YydD (DUF2326 family)